MNRTNAVVAGKNALTNRSDPMSGITAKDWELLSCFGVEPTLLDADLPWCYNDVAYLVEVDGLQVSFAVQPSYRDVRIIVRRGGHSIYELNAVGVADIRVLDEPGRDVVVIVLTDSAWLRLQLRPTFELTQGFHSLLP